MKKNNQIKPVPTRAECAKHTKILETTKELKSIIVHGGTIGKKESQAIVTAGA